MSSCDPCVGVGPNGSPGGGGGGGPVTLQAAITGQGVTPTEQSIVTSVDLNAGTGAWRFRDAANANMLAITDVVGVQVGQAFALTGDISPAALGAGATADYAPAGLATASVLRLAPNAANSTLTGLTTGADGREVTIENIGTAASLTLLHDDGASSAAANRFLCPNNSSVIIPPNGTVKAIYDSTSSRWRVITPQLQSVFFQQTFSQVGATLGTLNLAVVTNPGDRVLFRGLTVSAIFTAGVPAGDVGQIAYCGMVQFQNATTDAQVVQFADANWGVPPVAALQPNSVGYQPPLAFGNPGGIAVGVGAIGTTVAVLGLGIAGFTTRFDVFGEIYLFGTSTRIVA